MNWWHCELVTLRTVDIANWWHCDKVTLWTCYVVNSWLLKQLASRRLTHGLRTMYWLLRFVIEGKIEWRIEVTGRRGRRIKHRVNDLKEKKGYCKLKEDALDRSVCRTGFGRGCEPVVRQTAEWMSAVRENGRRSGHVSNCMSWSLLWDMWSDVRWVPSTLWPTSTVRDNSIYSPDFRHHLFSLCRPTRNTLSFSFSFSLSLSLSLSLCPFCCHPTTYSTRPHCSTVCTGPVLWKRFVMHFETYCIGKQDASISQLLTLKDTSMSSFHLLCRRIW